MTMDITTAFTLAILAAVILFDSWIIVTRGTKESISALIIRMSYSYPVIPLAIGIVIGHLFWQTPEIVCGGK